MERVAVVMPVFNEERSLVEVVSDWVMVLSQINGVLICINDGSKDRSLEILENLKERYQEELVLIDQKNRGHGYSVVQGYQKAIEIGCDYIFQTDSDNQIKAIEFFKLWKYHSRETAVLAVRELRDDSLIRIFMSRELHALTHFLFHSYLNDLNVPFRLMPVNWVREFLDQTPMRNAFAPNLFLSLFMEKRFKVKQVVVSHRRRQSGKNSLNFRRMIFAILRTLRDLYLFKRFNLEVIQNPS